MDWSAGGPHAALVGARAIHFGASALLAGALLFRAVVAGPPSAVSPPATARVDWLTIWTARGALAASVASGVVWFTLTAAEMGGLPLPEAIKPDVLQMIAVATQFGSVAMVRLALAIATAILLALDRITSARWLALAASLAL